jgi:hypothetical protein
MTMLPSCHAVKLLSARVNPHCHHLQVFMLALNYLDLNRSVFQTTLLLLLLLLLLLSCTCSAVVHPNFQLSMPTSNYLDLPKLCF